MADYQSIYEGIRMDELWTLAGQAVQGVFVTTGGQEVELEKDENGKVHINIGYLSLFRYDEETNTIYAGDNDHPVNFAAFGEVTAAGIGGDTPTPGSLTLGGLVNVVAEADNPQLTDKILVRRAGEGVTHWTLADLPVIQVQEAPIDGKQYARKNGGWIEVQSADVTPLEDAVKSLQSQIDSAASRTGYDELVVTSLFADTIVGTNAIFGQINGIDLTAKAAYWDAHITNTSNPHNVTWAQVKPTGGVALADLTSTIQATLSHADSLWDWFGIDENGNIYVKKDAQGNARNFYTYGEVTAGGIGTGGGGTTGGITRIYLGTDPTPYQPAEGSTEVTLPAYPVIPTALSAFTDDVNHRLVTDAQITAWNAKQNSLGTGANGQILSWQNNAPTWIAAPATGVTTFNGRSGAVSLTLADVEGVLNLTPIENAIKSLQSQVDSVSARDGFDELTATSLFADTLVGTNIYGTLHGNADSATNADTLDGQHASAFATAIQGTHGETAYNDLTTVSKAIQSLQSQIDSVASRDFAELAETLMSLKMWIEDMFEKTSSGIHAKYNLYSSGEITAGA